MNSIATVNILRTYKFPEKRATVICHVSNMVEIKLLYSVDVNILILNYK